MVNLPFSPDIIGISPKYTKETAKQYDEKIDEKLKEQTSVIDETEKNIQNQKMITISSIIENAIYKETLTQSQYQFTQQEIYTDTDFNDKTDTYINMNTSFRYITYNIDGAGTLYNQLGEGNNFRTDTPKKVFETIKNRLTALGFNKRINEHGDLETFDIENDKDLLYAIGFFQTVIENKVQNASKKDFRIGPLTLSALLDNKNTLHYTQIENKRERESKKETEENIKPENNKKPIEPEAETEKIIKSESYKDTEKELQKKDEITNKDEKITDNIKSNEENIKKSESKNEQKEFIGTREFPKTKDIYKEGTEQYVFTKADLNERGITDNIQYIQTIYQTLQLENNLELVEDANNLKEMLIKPWFQQLNMVINDMKTGITINNRTYEFSDNEINQAIKTRRCNQIMIKDGKLYEVNFSTRTPEMKKIRKTVHTLGDKEYQKSEGKSGNLKEKFQIAPQGILYRGSKGKNKNKEIYQVSVGDRILYSKE